MLYTTTQGIEIEMQPTADGEGGVTVKHFPDELMFNLEDSEISHTELKTEGDNANGPMHFNCAETFFEFMREYTTC